MMIDIKKAERKLLDTVREWAGERPDEYAMAKSMNKGRSGACIDKSCYHDEYYTSREQIEYLVVSNIAGSGEIETAHTKKPKYVKYDPAVHREPDNAPGCVNLDTIADGIPVYGGKIYVPVSIVMNMYWDRDNFDVFPEDLDIVVDGENKFKRLPILLKNKNLQPTDN